VVSWFEWSKDKKLGVERMEDLILITGVLWSTHGPLLHSLAAPRQQKFPW
jgi:hypothetical protein